MDKRAAIEIAKRYLFSLQKKYNIETAYLYGSFVKGTNHIDSDVDIAIVISQISDIIDVQIDLLQMRSDEDLIIEPHPFRKEDFDENNPVVAEILRSGIKIFSNAA